MLPETASQLIISCGEPAGIGPDLCIMLSQQALPFRWTVVADPDLLQQRARELGLPLTLSLLPQEDVMPAPGMLSVIPVTLSRDCVTGKPDPANAAYVLQCLDTALDYCQQDTRRAVVTAPVNKAVINDAGYAFSGHTEYLAHRTGAEHPVMLLATEGLRVALATTHLPLHAVSQAITQPLLEKTIRIIHRDMQKWFGLDRPVIHVCGLNPHAGENGHLGREEQDIISPVIDRLKQEGMALHGPFSADTVFLDVERDSVDVVLAMYHDQGLPVLKYRGFGKAVNITLGLPLVRTSVDHGTALELAGSGRVHSGSMLYAMQTAHDMLLHSLANQQQPG